MRTGALGVSGCGPAAGAVRLEDIGDDRQIGGSSSDPARPGASSSDAPEEIGRRRSPQALMKLRRQRRRFTRAAKVRSVAPGAGSVRGSPAGRLLGVKGPATSAAVRRRGDARQRDHENDQKARRSVTTVMSRQLPEETESDNSIRRTRIIVTLVLHTVPSRAASGLSLRATPSEDPAPADRARCAR